MDIFFNELSIKSAPHPDIAKNWMTILMTVYKSACSKGFKGFRILARSLEQELSEGYTLFSWAYDGSVDEVTRKLFLTEATKSPPIENLIDQRSVENHRLYEFRYNGLAADGLGAAFLFDSIAISLDNDSQWDNISVGIDVDALDEEQTNIITSTEAVKHASKTTHLENGLRPWISTKQRMLIRDGRILWEKRNELLPHLIFCECTRNQIFSLRESDHKFEHIKKRLFALENYCCAWGRGPFDSTKIEYRAVPESDTRKAGLRHLLTKLCPGGEHRLFSWHFKFIPGAGRIHFDPDDSRRICYIGHIGDKIQ